MQLQRSENTSVRLDGLRVALVTNRSDGVLREELENSLGCPIRWEVASKQTVKNVSASIKSGGLDVVLLANEFLSHGIVPDIFEIAKMHGVLAVPVGKGRKVEVGEYLKRYALAVDEKKRERAAATALRAAPVTDRGLVHRPFAVLATAETAPRQAVAATQSTKQRGRPRVSSGTGWEPREIAFVCECASRGIKSAAEVSGLMRVLLGANRTPGAVSGAIHLYVRHRRGLGAIAMKRFKQSKNKRVQAEVSELLSGVSPAAVSEKVQDSPSPTGRTPPPKTTPEKVKEPTVRTRVDAAGKLLVEVESPGGQMVVETSRSLPDLIAWLIGG